MNANKCVAARGQKKYLYDNCDKIGCSASFIFSNETICYDCERKNN
jgi:hypothetical protein